MKNLFALVIFSALLCAAACTRDNTSVYETAPTAETVEGGPENSAVLFARFAEGLADLPLPFTAACTFPYVASPLADTTYFRYFLQPHETPYRKIAVNDQVLAVLALFPTDETLPRLRTYNLSGEVLDEQDLKFTPCREEPGVAHREQFTIQKDLSIVHLDSTTRWQVDAQYNEVPNTRQLTVTRKKFRLGPGGEISEEK